MFENAIWDMEKFK